MDIGYEPFVMEFFYFEIFNMCLLNDLPREKKSISFTWRFVPDHVKIDSDHIGSLISNIVRR